MSVGYINDTTLTGIANAIREKNGESGLYLPSEMAAKIAAIEGGGEARIYGGAYDPDYYMDSASLICTLNGRTYTKYTSDPAYVAYFYRSDGYTGPILVSEVADGVKYTAYDSDIPYLRTITHQGKTYYYSDNPYPMAGNLTSSDGFAQKLSGTYATQAEAVEALLNLAIIDPPHIDITENGEYPVPQGYDGYGDLTVNVDATGEEYTYAETMEILGGESEFLYILNPDEMDEMISAYANADSTSYSQFANLSFAASVVKIHGLSVYDTTAYKYYWYAHRGQYNGIANVAFLGRRGMDRAGIYFGKKIKAGLYSTLKIKFQMSTGAYNDPHLSLRLTNNISFQTDDVFPESTDILLNRTLSTAVVASETIAQIDVSNITEDFYIYLVEWNGYAKIRAIWLEP